MATKPSAQPSGGSITQRFARRGQRGGQLGAAKPAGGNKPAPNKPLPPAIKPGQSTNPVPAGQIGSVPATGRSSGGGQRTTVRI